jgi:hypothetical protein
MVQSRRSALHLIGISLIGVLGGCTEDPRADGSTEQITSEPTRTSRPPVTNATRKEGGVREWEVPPYDFESTNEPFVTFVVGDPEALPRDIRPHWIVIESRRESSREISVRVQDRKATPPAIDAELQFPSRGVAQIQLATPSTYAVSVTVSGELTEFSVPQSTFDCNDSTTGVFVGSDGETNVTFVTTEMACGTDTEY